MRLGPRIGWGSSRPYVPLDEPGCFLWLRADLGVSTSFGAATAWANQGTMGGTFVQPTAAKQPLFTAQGAGSSLNPYLTWSLTSSTASSKTMVLSGATNVAQAAADYTFFFAGLPTKAQSNVTGNDTGLWLLDSYTSTSRLILAQSHASSATPGSTGFYQSTWQALTTPLAQTTMVMTFELVSPSANASKIYRNGTQVSSGTYGAQQALGGSGGYIALGSASTSNFSTTPPSAGFFDGQMFEFIGVSRTDAQMRSRVTRYLGTRYGITVSG